MRIAANRVLVTDHFEFIYMPRTHSPMGLEPTFYFRLLLRRHFILFICCEPRGVSLVISAIKKYCLDVLRWLRPCGRLAKQAENSAIRITSLAVVAFDKYTLFERVKFHIKLHRYIFVLTFWQRNSSGNSLRALTGCRCVMKDGWKLILFYFLRWENRGCCCWPRTRF